MQYQRNHILYRVLDGFFRNWLVFVITLVGVTSVVGSVLIVRSAKFVAEARIRISSEDVNHAVTKEFGKSSAMVTLTLSLGLTVALGAKLFGLY